MSWTKQRDVGSSFIWMRYYSIESRKRLMSYTMIRETMEYLGWLAELMEELIESEQAFEDELFMVDHEIAKEILMTLRHQVEQCPTIYKAVQALEDRYDVLMEMYEFVAPYAFKHEMEC